MAAAPQAALGKTARLPVLSAVLAKRWLAVRKYCEVAVLLKSSFSYTILHYL